MASKTKCVFVSYNCDEKDASCTAIRSFVESLELQELRERFDIYMFKGQNQPSTKESANEIEKADLVIAFINNGYQSNPYGAADVNYAFLKKKPILAVVVEISDKNFRVDSGIEFALCSALRVHPPPWLNRHDPCRPPPTLEMCLQEMKEEILRNINLLLDKEPTQQTAAGPFRLIGADFVNPTTYYRRRANYDENVLHAIVKTCQSPDSGALLITGDSGVGKSTLVTKVLLSEANQIQLENEARTTAALFLSCRGLNSAVDKDGARKTLLQKCFYSAIKIDKSQQFENIRQIANYFKNRGEKVLIVLDELNDVHLLEYFLVEQGEESETMPCCVITSEPEQFKRSHRRVAGGEVVIDKFEESELVEMFKTAFNLAKKGLADEQLVMLARLCQGLPRNASRIFLELSNSRDLSRTYNLMVNDKN